MSTPAADPIRDRQLQILGELAELGLEVARAVERRVREAEPEADLNALGMAYARVARAVRLSVMLQSRLLGERQLREASAARDLASDRQAAEAARRERVERIVERVVRDACGEDEDTADRLALEACERLDTDDIYGALGERPIGELVGMICQDLGVEPEWARMAGEAWAMAEAGQAGSPFSELVESSRVEGAFGSPFPMPPQSRRDSSPASGGARDISSGAGSG